MIRDALSIPDLYYYKTPIWRQVSKPLAGLYQITSADTCG
jgi:hypothetical protein